jgi:hypothetical protein
VIFIFFGLACQKKFQYHVRHHKIQQESPCFFEWGRGGDVSSRVKRGGGRTGGYGHGLGTSTHHVREAKGGKKTGRPVLNLFQGTEPKKKKNTNNPLFFLATINKKKSGAIVLLASQAQFQFRQENLKRAKGH